MCSLQDTLTTKLGDAASHKLGDAASQDTAP